MWYKPPCKNGSASWSALDISIGCGPNWMWAAGLLTREKTAISLLIRGTELSGNGTFDTDLPCACKAILTTEIVYTATIASLVLVENIPK